MIGAGALGCEFMKNFAMMGIATQKNNKIVITDNDNIEISNLSSGVPNPDTAIGWPMSTATTLSFPLRFLFTISICSYILPGRSAKTTP